MGSRAKTILNTLWFVAVLLRKEKVFEIDTSDQMVIPSLWASSIGLHLINIAAASSRRSVRVLQPQQSRSQH